MDSKRRRKARQVELVEEEEEVASPTVPEDEEDDDDVETDSDQESDDDIGDDDESGSELEAIFEGFTPKEGDFHGVKNLLNQLLQGFELNLSELADSVLAQPDVSSVLKVGDGDDEVFGVLCPLHLKKHAEVSSVKSLKKLILDQCRSNGSPTAKEQFSSALGEKSKKNVALLLNERMINLPQELALSLHGALQEDLEAFAEEDASFNFDSFLILCKSVESRSREAEVGSKKKKKKKSNGASACADDNELLFINVEDELFQKHCTASFSFTLPESQWVSRKGGLRERPSRTAMLLSKAQLNAAWKELESVFT